MPDTTTQHGTIYCKIIIAADFNNPMGLINNMQAKRTSQCLTLERLSRASCFKGQLTKNRKGNSDGEDFGDVHTVSQGKLTAETMTDVFKQFPPGKFLKIRCTSVISETHSPIRESTQLKTYFLTRPTVSICIH